MKLQIKYMVSLRCKIVVKAALTQLGLLYKNIELGEVDLIDDLTPEKRNQLNELLLHSGLSIMDDQITSIVESIKNVIVEMVHYADELPKVNISDYISEKLHKDYACLSGLFAATTGSTIQHFIMLHKIEKAKELILYDELNLTEIAYKLHYSSVAHLSSQFKKVTSLTPSYFRKLHDHKKRIMLETI
jgi:AraC-like DNA-binding protein